MFDRLEDLLIRFEEIMGELNEPNVTDNQTFRIPPHNIHIPPGRGLRSPSSPPLY